MPHRRLATRVSDDINSVIDTNNTLETVPSYLENLSTCRNQSPKMPIPNLSSPNTCHRLSTRPRGRPRNSERLSAATSSVSLPDFLRNSSLKIRRTEPLNTNTTGIASPPSKQNCSFPPSAIMPDNNFEIIPGQTRTVSRDPFDNLLKKMEAWREQDKEYLDFIKTELLHKVEQASAKIEEMKLAFTAENDSIRSELKSINTKLEVWESVVPSSDSTLGLALSQANSSVQHTEYLKLTFNINSIDKHLRRHNIIVHGLPKSNGSAFTSLFQFLESEFNLPKCVTEAKFIGVNRDRIKGTIDTISNKTTIMINKRNFNKPIFSHI
ncbi:hypothetical protein KQX54_012179 [Cotesia glomerata]|uniref:Uncharacterized protein n=1 Tax=Cotesia glomerata TaxID=32391 RepID=A0AAV7I322_COTGL|nr:hypothetical protein KQX54_012179 [Cotesia glomerata]